MSPSRSARLRVLFPLLVASVAACGATTGTSDDAGDPPATPPPNPEFPIRVKCATTPASVWDAASPGPRYDGFELRRRIGDAPYSVERTFLPLCTKASDAATCQATASAVSGEGWDPEAFSSAGPRAAQDVIIVATSGDEVGVVRSLDELAAALTPIDTPEEALLLLSMRDYRPTCALDGTANAARTNGDSFELLVRRGGACGSAVFEATVRVFRNGAITVVAEKEISPVRTDGPVCGRRPDGLLPLEGAQHDGLGGLLARMAWLEAASVPAFGALARDLARHGAPPELVARALAARADEIMHARLTREAARRHGVTPEPPRVPRAEPRTLFELALENAVEGCVREGFGALVATHQAQHASDPALAAMFSTIAADETEHAALSLDLAEWIEPLLSDADRATLDAARAGAFAELEASLGDEPSPEEQVRGGMPSLATSRRLLDALRAVHAES